MTAFRKIAAALCLTKATALTCCNTRIIAPDCIMQRVQASDRSTQNLLAWEWRLASDGRTISTVAPTGSMEPDLTGGDLLCCEKYTGQPLAAGMVVVFDRGDFPNVCHEIAALSLGGRFAYMKGTNNRFADGWFPKGKIKFIVRRVITLSHHEPTPAR